MKSLELLYVCLTFAHAAGSAHCLSTVAFPTVKQNSKQLICTVSESPGEPSGCKICIIMLQTTLLLIMVANVQNHCVDPVFMHSLTYRRVY